MKNIGKLHVSEILTLVSYVVITALFFSDDAGAAIMLICIPAVTVFAIWSMVQLKRISLTLWPLYVFLGVIPGLLLGNLGGASGPAAAIGMFFVLLFVILISIHLVCCMLFAIKDLVKVLTVIGLAFALTLAFDATFITANEYGERGCSYAMSKHADWRVICD